jgi:uncharacterized Zn-binding protein involved in type VI secretion
MPAIARIGDRVTHNHVQYGVIRTGAPRTLVEGMPAARIGDLVQCPAHGLQTIVSGSATVLVEGKPVARVGDLVSCGATIISGAGTVQAG